MEQEQKYEAIQEWRRTAHTYFRGPVGPQRVQHVPSALEPLGNLSGDAGELLIMSKWCVTP